MGWPGGWPPANCSRTSASKHNVAFTMQRAPGGDSDTYYQEDFTPALVNSSFAAVVAWADANNFLDDMLGRHTKAGTSIFRINPEVHPYHPLLNCVGCKTVRNIGAASVDAAHNNAIQYEFVEYLCTFAAFLYDVKEDVDVAGSPKGELIRYIERRPRQIGQSIQTSLAGFEFTSDSTAIITPPALQVPYREVNYVWRYVPGPLGALTTLADSYYGTVNDAVFDAGGDGPDDVGYPAGTMMYMGMDRDPVPSTPAGNRLYHLTHKFVFFYHGWNSAYRASGGNIYTDAAGNVNTAWDIVRLRTAPKPPPYASKAFNNLFHL